jgi:hypothetical protein
VVVGQDLTGGSDDDAAAGGFPLAIGQRRIDDGHGRVDLRFDDSEVQTTLTPRTLGTGSGGDETDQSRAEDECGQRGEAAPRSGGGRA